MFSLCISLAILGLVSIDPVGIGVMPLLLLQKNPLQRSLIFLAGSFCALEVMGIVFASGFGALILHVEKANSWLVPTIEGLAGFVLLLVAAVTLVRLCRGNTISSLPRALTRQLTFNNGGLFGVGAGLVVLQSLVDVVFIVATVRIGQLHVSSLELAVAVTTYVVAALVLQLAVVLTYRLTPPAHRKRTIEGLTRLIAAYTNEVVLIVSLIVGVVLVVIALRQWH